MNQDPLGNAIPDQMTLQHQKFFESNIKTSLRVKSDLKSLKGTRRTAHRFFKNCVVEVKGETVCAINYDELDSDIFIFIDKILGRDFVLGELRDEDTFLSDVTCHKGIHFYRWCQNLCRFKEGGGDWIFDQQSFKSLASGFGYLLHRAWNEQTIVVFTDKDMISGVE